MNADFKEILRELAAAIRAHDLPQHESATPASGATAEASDPRTAEASGAHGVADPDVAGLIEREGVLLDESLEDYALRNLRLACTHWSGSRDTKGFMDLAESELAAAFEAKTKSAIREAAAALQRQADQLAEVRNALDATDVIVVAAKQAHANAQFRAEAAEKELAEVRRAATPKF